MTTSKMVDHVGPDFNVIYDDPLQPKLSVSYEPDIHKLAFLSLCLI